MPASEEVSTGPATEASLASRTSSRRVVTPMTPLDLQQAKLRGGVGQWVSTHVVATQPVYHNPSTCRRKPATPRERRGGPPDAFLVTHRTAKATDLHTTVSFWEQDAGVIENHIQLIESLEERKTRLDLEEQKRHDDMKKKKHDDILREFYEMKNRNDDFIDRVLPAKQKGGFTPRGGALSHRGGGAPSPMVPSTPPSGSMSARSPGHCYRPPMLIHDRIAVERDLRLGVAPATARPGGFTIEEEIAELDEFEDRLKVLAESSLQERLRARLTSEEGSDISRASSPRKTPSSVGGEPLGLQAGGKSPRRGVSFGAPSRT